MLISTKVSCKERLIRNLTRWGRYAKSGLTVCQYSSRECSPSVPSIHATAFAPAVSGGGGGNSSLVFSAIILWKPMPTPSMTANRIAHPMAPFRIALAPPRTAKEPPVKKPAMMAFQGSSFLRTPLTAQSAEKCQLSCKCLSCNACLHEHGAYRGRIPNVEKSPPQTPKLPPSTGARALIAVIATTCELFLLS